MGMNLVENELGSTPEGREKLAAEIEKTQGHASCNAKDGVLRVARKVRTCFPHMMQILSTSSGSPQKCGESH